MEERLRKLFSSVFQIPADYVSEDISMDSFSDWDSLKHLTLILALEKEFAIRFSEDEFPKLDSYSSVLSLVRTKSTEK